MRIEGSVHGSWNDICREENRGHYKEFPSPFSDNSTDVKEFREKVNKKNITKFVYQRFDLR